MKLSHDTMKERQKLHKKDKVSPEKQHFSPHLSILFIGLKEIE